MFFRYESVIVAREEGRMLQEQLLKKQKKVIIYIRFLFVFSFIYFLCILEN